ncbi:MAG: hypothetical protein Q8L48_24475 [Archangium sp.]|nr:hypothetical protein [Archangium sp.]
MKMTLGVLLLGVSALATPRPSAVQLCVELPPGVELFSTAAAPNYRELGPGLWMLDFDVRLDGQLPERITRANPSCLRAWLQPRAVRQVTLDFERMPLNFTAEPRAVDLKLKADLLHDAGELSVAQAPFARVKSTVDGALTFARVTAAGLVKEPPDALPSGQYVVSYVPTALPTGKCKATVEVVAMGSLTQEKNPRAVAELAEHYAQTLLPFALEEQGVTCTDAEEVAAEVLLVDGIFYRPLKPKLVKRTIAARQPRYELRHDGQVFDLAQPARVTVEPGQTLEVTKVVAATAAAAETPPMARPN